ncbi:MarR family winged helix-turn-helix transcriptional regulator [Limosilactobacillus mucosae]|uniref:MarR family winged helix-turn-helix transcriptional regulator n=1 Tax=Limosilactobacillus mucosae TaxID=97478 RepID=UPI00088C73C5|nr:MarR family transcriptional regulator [Limosilactobacillus mucosae]SDN39371.1 DNA-binding transcriptional regulator, MarR family [Limosilactobacillus mucosae]SEK93049.1 DNA-binding transcriptional regulator, MarR family [Limosilactobacillus mucosae]SFK15515.1 DNA-binding transcriptional regulator, MarR family [Limosilactobacillus mucosae]
MAISNEMLFGHLFLLGMDIRTASKPKQRGFHGQGRVLFLLSKHENISQRELANLARIKPGSMTEILSRMERDGLIKRQRDESDKRIIHVRLTQAGADLAKENHQCHQWFCKTLFETLNDEEKAEFNRLILKVDQHLKSQFQEGENSHD